MMQKIIIFMALGLPSTILAQFVSQSCSDNVARFGSQSANTDYCLNFTRGNTYLYPEDFTILNSRTWYECPTSGLRIVVSNNIPDHDVTIGNPNAPCVIPWHVRFPLYPEFVENLTEPAPLGLVGMQLNGVGVYGAKEGFGSNAVEPLEGSVVLDAQYWYGHTAPTYDWHYHHPQIGFESTPSSDTLMGYAMDGFGIYGPLDDDSVLDDCNGRMVDGEYRYHVRSLDQVDENGDYCNGDSPAVLWRYIVGCFHGDTSSAEVLSSDTAEIPADCVVVDTTDEIDDTVSTTPTLAPTALPTLAPTAVPTSGPTTSPTAVPTVSTPVAKPTPTGNARPTIFNHPTSNSRPTQKYSRSDHGSNDNDRDSNGSGLRGGN